MNKTVIASLVLLHFILPASAQQAKPLTNERYNIILLLLMISV
ncbi:MAG: hypothetical protein ACR2KX_20155 [Chitinophagaceae bacterium]